MKSGKSYITFENVCVDFPVYNASCRSLKKRLIQVATGGKLNTDQEGKVVVRALDGISFKLVEGDRVGLLGHNGAGKSTLLRVLSSVYHPSSGTATIVGKTGALIDIALGIDPEATGLENIFVRGGLLGLSKPEVKSHLADIIAFSELGDFIEMPLRTYSTGMHMRLAFAVSTLLRPQILLMDEWLSVGDEGFRRKAEQRMVDLVEATRILILASHSKELILNTCNRAIWLEHGKIRMDGPAGDVVAAYFDR